MKNEKPLTHRLRSFVRREGQLTKAQERALKELWSTYGINIDQGLLNLNKLSNKIVLEIGFGMGDSLFQTAKAHPDIFYIGIEVHRPGVGYLLNLIHNAQLKNVRIFCHDAVEVLEKNIQNNSLNVIQIFFPDPWPKKRHHKRRLIQPDFVKLLWQKLKPNGILHLATDWQNYAEHMLAILNQAEGFKNLSPNGAFSPHLASRPQTKFEKRGKTLGHAVWDLIFQKISLN